MGLIILYVYMVVQVEKPWIATVMSGMDGRAFGSPVAAATMATNACGSVGERVVQGSGIRLFQDGRESIQRSTEVPGTGIVELLGPGGNVVGMEVLQDNIKCGMELNAVNLCPFEVAVQVVQVLDESMWTWEIVGEWLSQYVGFVIRWRRADVRSVSGGTSSVAESGAGQNFSFPFPGRSDFEFKDEDTGNGDSSDPSHREEGTNAARSMSPMTEASQCTTGTVLVLDGLPIGGQSRRYSMRNHHTRATPVQGMGVRIQDRVKLDNVLEAKVQGGCLRNCLKKVGERYILDQRYMAWVQKYEVRATWIMQMLNAFYQRTEGMRRDKYNTKLDGMEVCNACYAMALGYSQRRFKQLKVAHRVYGRVAAVHGNTCNLREQAKMSAAREFYSIRRRCGMYTTRSPGTEEGRQLCSAVDFIAHEHHEGGCVLFSKWRGEDVDGRGIHVTSVVPPAIANRIFTCSNTPILEVLKVLPLLGV
jgi:hypothetical protein